MKCNLKIVDLRQVKNKWIDFCDYNLSANFPYDLFRWSICIPKFEIQNAARETVLKIEGPFCQCNICGDVEFHVRIIFPPKSSMHMLLVGNTH